MCNCIAWHSERPEGREDMIPKYQSVLGEKKRLTPEKPHRKTQEMLLPQAVVLKRWGWILTPLPGDSWQPLATDLVVRTGRRREDTGVEWLEGTRDTAHIPPSTGLPHNKDLAPHATGPTLRIPGVRILFWGFTQFICSGHLTSSSRALLRTSDTNPQREAPGLSLSSVSLVLAQAG